MPLDPNAPQSEQVNARLSAEMLALIDEYAQAEMRSRSLMIRVLLAEAIIARQGKDH